VTSAVYSLVRQAILEKKQVHAVFAGLPRRLCPHVIGAKNGRPQALFFQFGGSSRRGPLPAGDWRCLPIDQLTDVSIHEGSWRTRRHTQPQSCVDEVDLEVEL